MKHYSILLPVSVILAVLMFSGSVHAIKKCKDADGNWHYGDIAVAGCEESKVTTLNDRGFITEQVDAPKTEEELQLEQELQAAEEAERMRIKQEEEERIRILSIYETEDDIDRQRDNQVSSVQGNIMVHEAYLKSMATRIERTEKELAATKAQKKKEQLQTEIDQANARVERSKKELVELIDQKESIIKKFEKEKEIYLALKNVK